MRNALGWAFGLAVLVGCRGGPSEQQIAGSGLVGALLFVLTSWGILTGVDRVWARLKTGDWPKPRTHRGFAMIVAGHLALSVVAVLSAEQVKEIELVGIIWACAGANHLAWSVVIWRLGGRLSPVTAVALASVPSLLVALPGGLGSHDFAIAALLQWLWGGVLGAVPAVLILLVWLEAWLRREPPPAPDSPG
ncbi:MAG: hypothetical protein ACI9U2_001145 [Bradymonadia bacterium]|jgi:hypothetical protein